MSAAVIFIVALLVGLSLALCFGPEVAARRRPHPSLAEIKARARMELAINETITIYEILDDGYLLRRPANPLVGLGASMRRLGESGQSIAREFRALADAMGAEAGERP